MGKKGKKKQRGQIQGRRVGRPAHEYNASRRPREPVDVRGLIQRYFQVRSKGGKYYQDFSESEFEAFMDITQFPDLDRQVPQNLLPSDVVLANRKTLKKMHPNHNSYDGYPWYYQDKPFDCVDCGKAQIWTAAQQKWWYEEAGGSLYAFASRCRPCRQALKKVKMQIDISKSEA